MLGAFKLKALSKKVKGHPAVEPIGIIHADSFSSLGAFTQSGSIFSIVSNQLRMSTTAGNHTNYLRYTSSNPYRIHMLEKWKMSIKFTMPTAGSTTYGFGLGVLSNNSYGKFSNAMRIGLDTGGGVGKVYVYHNTNGTVGQSEIASSFTPSNGVQYIWEVERVKNQIIGRIKSSNGLTTHATYTHTYNITTNNSVRSHNRGEFVIYGYGGTITFDDLVIESSAQKNIKILALGDSNMYGLYSETNARRYVEQACDALGYTFEICAGIDAGIADLQAIINQVIDMNPEHIYINILSNDLANGTSSGTFQGNFSTFISDLNTAGYDINRIIIGIPCARNGVSISSLKSHIDSTYSSYERVDLYSITKNAGDTNLQSSLQIGDNIHMDEDGNDVCTTPLQLAIEQKTNLPLNLKFNLGPIATPGVPGWINLNGEPYVDANLNTDVDKGIIGRGIGVIFVNDGSPDAWGELTNVATGNAGATGGLYPNNVMSNYIFTADNRIGRMKIYNLPDKTYTIKAFGSRGGLGGGVNRTTRYSIDSVNKDLNCANNTSNYVEWNSVVPTGGEITISCTNQSSSDSSTYGYLNALELIEE